MRAIDLPTLRATDVVAVTIECADLAGSPAWIVTVREAPNYPIRRRWHHDPGPALAYAGEQAERHCLPLLDLRDPGETE
jgi:hypothetical protein